MWRSAAWRVTREFFVTTRANDERMLRDVPYQIKAIHAAGVHRIETPTTSRNLRGDATGAVAGTKILDAAANETDVFSLGLEGAFTALSTAPYFYFQFFFIPVATPLVQYIPR